MDEDMKRRVSERQAVRREESKKIRQEAKHSRHTDSRERMRHQDITKMSMYSNMRSELRGMLEELEPLFDNSLEARMMRLTGNFSLSLGTMKVRGAYTHDEITSYDRPEHEMSPLYNEMTDYKSEWRKRYLIIKLAPSYGIAISCRHNQSIKEWEENDRDFTYEVESITREPRLLLSFPENNLPFPEWKSEKLFSGGWRIGGKPYDSLVGVTNTFTSRQETLDFIKDKIAEAILENKKFFALRAAKRGLKLTAAAGLTALFLKSCTPAFGAEYDPANDFMPPQPEEPAAHLIMGEP